MPNVGDPSMAKRRLLAMVVSSRLLYAAPVWATRAGKFKCNSAMLGKVKRLVALRITRCYRTVSTAAAFFFGGDTPSRSGGSGKGNRPEAEEGRKRGGVDHRGGRQGGNNRGVAVPVGRRDFGAGWTKRGFFLPYTDGLGGPLVPPLRIGWRRL